MKVEFAWRKKKKENEAKKKHLVMFYKPKREFEWLWLSCPPPRFHFGGVVNPNPTPGVTLSLP